MEISGTGAPVFDILLTRTLFSIQWLIYKFSNFRILLWVPISADDDGKDENGRFSKHLHSIKSLIWQTFKEQVIIGPFFHGRFPRRYKYFRHKIKICFKSEQNLTVCKSLQVCFHCFQIILHFQESLSNHSDKLLSFRYFSWTFEFK